MCHRVVVLSLGALGVAAGGAQGEIESSSALRAESSLRLQPADEGALLAPGEEAFEIVEGPSWSFELDAVYWYPWVVDAEPQIGANKADFELNPSDTFDDDESLAPLINFEAWSSEGWGLAIRASYISVDFGGADGFQNNLPLGLALDSEIEWFYADVLAGIRLLESPGNRFRNGGSTLDFFVGARLSDIDIELTANQQPISADETFVEPIIGLRADVGLRRNLVWSTDVELAGGVEGTDLTWMIDTGLEYKVADRVSVVGGYRVLQIDYDDDNDDLDGPALDGTFHGPYLGIRFAF